MRRVIINGTPPQDWLNEAQAVTQKMHEAAKILLSQDDYDLQVLPNLKSDAEMPSTGVKLLTIGDVAGRLALRLFDTAGHMTVKVLEPEKVPDDSPFLSLRDVLSNNWDTNQLKQLEKTEIFKLSTSIIRSALIDYLIDKNQKLWRDDRIRGWLLDQFNNKCWYSEAQDSVSSIHVDHYRPKGRLKEALGGATADGYWWLAFEWTNYVICGELLNVKKGDLFPFADGVRSKADNNPDIKHESPLLIDPREEEAPRFISYEKDDGEACIAVTSAGIGKDDEKRVSQTIEIMGLNRLSRLNRKRASFWDDCLKEIANYKGASGHLALKQITQASAKTRLRQMVAYEAEFSSVSEACIRKNAPESLIASIFEKQHYPIVPHIENLSPSPDS